MSAPPFKRLRVLAIDHEGGHGGSSRSLYFLLSDMDRRDLDIEVWCRRPSDLTADYAAIGIPCRVAPEIPLFRAQNTLRYTVRTLLEGVSQLLRRRRALQSLARSARDFDVIHFNYESLLLFAAWLRRKTDAAFVLHMRHCPRPSVAVAAQARAFSRVMDRFVFITSNERDRFAEVGGDAARGTIIFNAAAAPKAAAPHPDVPRDGRLNVAILANGQYDRGLDRAIDICVELAKRHRRDKFRFVVGGDATLSPRDPAPLGELARAGRTLADYAADRGVGDMGLFLGHVKNPEAVLAAADMTARLTRRNDPWGRDVIESLAAGLPMLATGTWDGFLRDCVSGWLVGQFDPVACADRLEWAEKDRGAVRRMGEAGRAHVGRVCDARARASDLREVWRVAAVQRGARVPVADFERMGISARYEP